jgi:hypothetical protein
MNLRVCLCIQKNRRNKQQSLGDIIVVDTLAFQGYHLRDRIHITILSMVLPHANKTTSVFGIVSDT